ncbi:hypothetical protein ACIRQQ_40605 [Streptomyces fuscichromogenes]|uniref:hypothetical protein n=1 Tax=Streptomyces fuscichromogenes TaxID=1324013 RepID=UPI0037F74F94
MREFLHNRRVFRHERRITAVRAMFAEPAGFDGVSNGGTNTAWAARHATTRGGQPGLHAAWPRHLTSPAK